MDKEIIVNVTHSDISEIPNKTYSYQQLNELVKEHAKNSTDGKFFFSMNIEINDRKHKVGQFFQFDENTNDLIECISHNNDKEIEEQQKQKESFLTTFPEKEFIEWEERLNGIKNEVIPFLKNLEVKEEPNVEHPLCKGYAYTANTKKPVVLYGDSKEEILGKINTWNLGRTEENKFTNCNIGRLENETYTDYHRYTPDGKDISYIYLTLPHVNREEFKQITSELKERGARYNAYKKAWYIKPEQKDEFKDYIASNQSNSEDQEAPIRLIDLPSFTIKPQYEIKMEDGRIYYLEQENSDLDDADAFINKLCKFIKNSIDNDKSLNAEAYKKKISMEFKQNHFKANNSVIDNIMKYNELVGVQTSLKELSLDYKNREQFTGERRTLIDSIGQELKNQQIVERDTLTR